MEIFTGRTIDDNWTSWLRQGIFLHYAKILHVRFGITYKRFQLEYVLLKISVLDYVFQSSLLMALLRELPVTSGSIRISGRVAYVSQQPWVFSGTLKENILFGKIFDKERYEEVIHVCALDEVRSLKKYIDILCIYVKNYSCDVH